MEEIYIPKIAVAQSATAPARKKAQLKAPASAFNSQLQKELTTPQATTAVGLKVSFSQPAKTGLVLNLRKNCTCYTDNTGKEPPYLKDLRT